MFFYTTMVLYYR